MRGLSVEEVKVVQVVQDVSVLNAVTNYSLVPPCFGYGMGMKEAVVVKQ